MYLVTALGDVAILAKDLDDPSEGHEGIESGHNNLCWWTGPTRRLGIKRIRLQVVRSLSEAGTRVVLEVGVDVAELSARARKTRIGRGGVILIVLFDSISQLLQ
jgi:hypothetical protein